MKQQEEEYLPSFSLGTTLGEQHNVASGHGAQAAYEMIRLILIDYCQAKKQLERICRSFDEMEGWIGERLSYLSRIDSDSSLETDDTLAIGDKFNSHKHLTLPSLASLRVYCLGKFEVYMNWNKIEKWHNLKAKSLLKFLVTRRNKSTTADILIEIMWPNCDLKLGRDNLKTSICSLRHILSSEILDNIIEPIILFSEGQYLINPKIDLWVDIDQFEHHWLAGRALEKSKRTEEAIKEYRLAEELYRGDYLEDDLYAEWTLLTREVLKDTYLTILSKLANYSFQTGDYESCIFYSQKILAKDMCQEEAYRWLIRCYGSLGQPHRARQWYGVCVSNLRKELDVVPDCKTAALYSQLLKRNNI
jgi:DNA-binding SARP family transcriptional activator